MHRSGKMSGSPLLVELIRFICNVLEHAKEHEGEDDNYDDHELELYFERSILPYPKDLSYGSLRVDMISFDHKQAIIFKQDPSSYYF